MKYQQGKIKGEHHTLNEFKKDLQHIATIAEVVRIIPGRISRQQKGTSKKHITLSYTTASGLKLTMKKGGTAQEVFLICKQEDTEILLTNMRKLHIIPDVLT